MVQYKGSKYTPFPIIVTTSLLTLLSKGDNSSPWNTNPLPAITSIALKEEFKVTEFCKVNNMADKG